MSEELKKRHIVDYAHGWYPIVSASNAGYSSHHDTVAMNVPGGALVCVQPSGTTPTMSFVPNVVLMKSPEKKEHVEADEAEGENAYIAVRTQVELVYGGEQVARRKEKGWKVL